ncbi:MAG: hydrogenase [Planctomycetes bacterium GWF2_50_10]|nr:MAG: hydrogenase [Planctomycetes bacterium GWF2_50_10]
MFKIILARLRQGHHTMEYPDGPAPKLSDRFRGCPVVKADACCDGCADCAGVCPTGAIVIKDNHPCIDMGKCLFCSECANACGQQAIKYSDDYRLAARRREDLVVCNDKPAGPCDVEMERDIKKLFGRSLKLRQVSAGGCNACEADTNVLNTLAWDLGRFGIQFVASPRHADGLLITGPVTQNMHLALKKTYDALPQPKIVIAVGACAIAGGPYIDHEQVKNGADTVVPVDLYIPGCPPHPLTILDGLIRFLGQKEAN